MSGHEQSEGPPGWKRTSLGQALPIRYGKARNEKIGTVREDTPVYGSSGKIDTFKRALTAGPSLIIGRKGTVGATYYCPEPCWPIDTVYFAEASANEDLRFFKYLLDHLQLARMDRSTAVPGLSRDDYNATEVFIPELDQQRLIVAEIEKQFSRLDEAVASIKRTKANLQRYKAAVLKAAVEGKLTEDWRLSARAASRRRAQASELEAIPKAGKDKWFVYIIECDDGSYYVGHTADLHDRWQRHCEGSGADWTRQHPPKYLVRFEECGNREDAVKREQDLKTGFGRTWRKREIDAGRMKPLVHNPANETAQPVHGEDMQTGGKLLERILAERRAKWNGRGGYSEPAHLDIRGLPKLADGWVWTRLDAIAALKGGITVDKSRKSSTARTVPYLRVANVQRGFLDLSEVKEIKAPEADIRDLRLVPGDILFNEGGDRDKLGRGWVWEGQLPECIHQNHVFRARLYLPEVFSKLVSWWGNSFGQTYFLREGKQTTNLASINITKLSAFPIPLPPREEQQMICQEVERRLSVIDELEATVQANLTRAERLRQSILQKAFAGRLVIQSNHTRVAVG